MPARTEDRKAPSLEAIEAEKSGPAQPRRQRMAASDREEAILEAATSYFAEHGLSAGTPELASRIGITQPLLYKYFPTKDVLIERVFDRLLQKNQNPEWEALLGDDSVPIHDRVVRFYTDYVTSVLTYEHVRLFLFSGLSRAEFNTRYYNGLTKRVLKPIARGMRRQYGSAERSGAVTKYELELVQSLHGTMYHIGFRRWVHGETFNGKLESVVRSKIDAYFAGVADAFERLNKKSQSADD